MADRGLGAWLRWIALSEALILAWAAVGPGYRHAAVQEADPGLLARFFIEDPGFLEAFAVNVVGMHLFVGAAFLAAWAVGRARRG